MVARKLWFLLLSWCVLSEECRGVDACGFGCFSWIFDADTAFTLFSKGDDVVFGTSLAMASRPLAYVTGKGNGRSGEYRYSLPSILAFFRVSECVNR